MDGDLGNYFGNYYSQSSSTGSLNSSIMGIGYGFSAINAALSGYNTASLQKAADQYQAKIADNNVKIADWQAQSALQRGEHMVAGENLKTNALISTQRATFAANGVDITSASSRDVIAGTKYIGNIDAATIADNAAREAWGYEVAATNASNSSAFYAASASNINPVTSGFSSFLSSAGSVASKWYVSSRLGVPGYGGF